MFILGTLMSASMAIRVLVLAVVALELIGAVRVSLRSGVSLVRGMRWWEFPRAWVVLFPTLVLAVTLSRLPILSWGWWQAVGGEGSVVVGKAGEGSVAALISLMFLVLLVLVVPELARREEIIFRRGSERRSNRARLFWSFMFGLVHALMGIPLGAALALTLAGMFFTWRYMSGWAGEGGDADARGKRALTSAVHAHAAWNWSLLLFAIVFSVIALLE
jgi:hypothetical protein